MKLKNESSVLDFGDTSFRRKEYMSEYRTLLVLLEKHMENGQTWARNADSQRDFYETVIDQTNLFDRNETEDKKMAKRGRTLTNSLVKTGLINGKREVSDAGRAWLHRNLAPLDEFEKVLSISEDNLIFFRQWSKLRLYNVAGDHYIKPFLFMLKMLSRYKDIPRNNLEVLVLSISPSMGEKELDEIIDKYQLVIDNQLLFDQFLNMYIDQGGMRVEESRLEAILNQKPINEDDFNQFFKNGKSMEAAAPIYLKFVESVLLFREKPTRSSMMAMLRLSKQDKIKKAFGYNATPFNSSKAPQYTLSDFRDDNGENPLLSGSVANIYNVFKNSKRYDLIREYGDMTYRLTNLAGIINYDNGIANLPLQPIFTKLFDKFEIRMSGTQPFDEFEGELGSEFYSNNSFIASLHLNSDSVRSGLEEVAGNYELSDVSKLVNYFEDQKNNRFVELVKNRFPQLSNQVQH
ncbi:hypothetical protein IV54_GL001211 [Levilactobacillus paucivorans]|uniref:AlwI restriction endonuclease n=1 Tax=Levilactobacillus paucivorans TaxID=616990 RepID=A0A0R2LHR2_9LACO|nr:hypothetical protein [Levilactobacillus paucivorans]KRN97636.1 hypothetical protein IV54_GL001211 [Levilactobacillus paucivorans]